MNAHQLAATLDMLHLQAESAASAIDEFAAKTPEQASYAAVDVYGDGDCLFPLDQVIEVPEAEMKRLKVNDESDGKTRTFEEQVTKLIKEGATKPMFFASTEY